jgi:hypothetical protein
MIQAFAEVPEPRRLTTACTRRPFTMSFKYVELGARVMPGVGRLSLG